MDQPRNIPMTAPEMAPLKLVTMTVNFNIGIHLNLDIVSRFTPINDIIKGIQYRELQRGVSKEKKKNQESGRFKNQCTFVIDVGTKNVNTKLFNNGKIVTVGCKNPDHAIIASKILTSAFQNMEGEITYEVPRKLIGRCTKKFYKDELRKKFSDLITYLALDLNIDIDLEPFSQSVSHEEGYEIYSRLMADEGYEEDLSYICTVISIIKHYYEDNEILDRYQDPDFQDLLKTIREGTDDNKTYIRCVLPAYLGHAEQISINNDQLEIVLINKSTNCGYYLNRNAIMDLLQSEPNVIECKFDKNRYPGVITTYDVGGKHIKIIFFNTGKINITATRTHEQVESVYQFAAKFCADNFNKLLLVTEYENKIREYDEKLPDQHYVGQRGDENHHYYLLKKSSITGNPRNVRYLNMQGLLQIYQD